MSIKSIIFHILSLNEVILQLHAAYTACYQCVTALSARRIQIGHIARCTMFVSGVRCSASNARYPVSTVVTLHVRDPAWLYLPQSHCMHEILHGCICRSHIACTRPCMAVSATVTLHVRDPAWLYLPQSHCMHEILHGCICYWMCVKVMLFCLLLRRQAAYDSAGVHEASAGRSGV